MTRDPSHAGPSSAGALPVDPTTLHPEPDGFLGRRARARREKLLSGIEDVLRRALVPGERIRYAAVGCRYYLGEYWFSGAAVAYHHNRMALVLTDQRLLLVQVGTRGRPGDLKNQVLLQEIRGAGRTFLSGWRIRLADGRHLKFVAMKRADQKRLEALLPKADGPKAAQPSLQHLCPACLRAVPGPVGATASCPEPACRIPFRDPEKATRLSTWVPGLGDLYLRHHLFGGLEFLGSMLMLGLALAFGLGAILDPQPSSAIAAAFAALLGVVIPRVIDRRITRHMAGKGLVPLALAPAPGAQARNLPSFPRWSPLLFAAGLALLAGVPALIIPDLRHDAAVREATELVRAGRFDDALSRWDALEAAGGAGEERRIRLALALLEAGDLAGADTVRAGLQGTPVDAQLAARFDAAVQRTQAAFDDYRRGVEALVQEDDASATPALDRAFAYLRGVRRPHFPATRAELHAHLASELLAEPLAESSVQAAPRWIEGAQGAPPAELAVVKAAWLSTGDDAAAARAALAAVDPAALPLEFQVLALEARARLAADGAARAEVVAAARALGQQDLPDDELGARIEALTAER